MADVTIDGAISTATARGMRSLVFVTADIGYQFYIDGGSFKYSKTTDGGATWGAPVQVELNAATTYLAFDVWFDQWTPGDAGTLIHCVYFNTTDDDVFYRTLDTNGDTLGTQRTVFAGATSVAGAGCFCTVTKTRSGYLYVAYDIDAGAERGVHRSTDAGVNWSANLSTTFVEATLDWACAYPASNTGDDNDCWFLYHDVSADALTLKMWDSSAAAAVESATIATLIENLTDTTAQYPWSASVRHSDGHLIVAVITERDTATADHRVFDINGTGSIVEKTAITTNIDDHYYPSVFIDQATDDIYVAYNGLRTGGETLGTTTKAYYTKSTDGGTTWSAGDTACMEGAAAAVLQTWAPLMGPRFGVAWRTGTTLNFNKVNSVTFASDVTGSVSVTEAADTSSASGAVTVTGSVAVAEAQDTLASSGNVEAEGTISGSVSVSEAADTLAASGAITVSGSVSVAEAADTLAAAGVLIVAGSIAATEAADVSAIAGAIRVSGSVAVSEGDDTLSASGSIPLPVSGSVSIIEESDAIAASVEVEILAPPAAASNDGAWVKLTGEYPAIRRREPPPAIPFPPELAPAAPPPAPTAPPAAVEAALVEAAFGETLAGELVAPVVPRGKPSHRELAIALLLAA